MNYCHDLPDIFFYSLSTGKDNICKRCNLSMAFLVDFIKRNNKEAYYETITIENINKFYPCISDNEYLMRSVLL